MLEQLVATSFDFDPMLLGMAIAVQHTSNPCRGGSVLRVLYLLVCAFLDRFAGQFTVDSSNRRSGHAHQVRPCPHTQSLKMDTPVKGLSLYGLIHTHACVLLMAKTESPLCSHGNRMPALGQPFEVGRVLVETLSELRWPWYG